MTTPTKPSAWALSKAREVLPCENPHRERGWCATRKSSIYGNCPACVWYRSVALALDEARREGLGAERVTLDNHLAVVEAVAEQARREALEEAAGMVNDWFIPVLGGTPKNRKLLQDMLRQQLDRLATRIRALATVDTK